MGTTKAILEPEVLSVSSGPKSGYLNNPKPLTTYPYTPTFLHKTPCYSNYSALMVTTVGSLRSLTLPTVRPHPGMFLASARPLHCGTTSHATDQATPGVAWSSLWHRVSLGHIPKLGDGCKDDRRPTSSWRALMSYQRVFSLRIDVQSVGTSCSWFCHYYNQLRKLSRISNSSICLENWQRYCSQRGCWTSSSTGQIWSTV